MLPTTGVANTSVGIPSAHTTVRVNKVLTPEGLLSNSTGRAFFNEDAGTKDFMTLGIPC